MAVNQEYVSKILSVLSHVLRRDILLILSKEGECSFTTLMNTLNVDTGKLSFHIRSLAIFLEQTPTGKYKLNKVGENAIKLLKDLEIWAEEAEITMKASPTLSLATFKKRALAFILDSLMMLVMAILIILPNIFSLITEGNAFQLDFTLIVVITITLLYLYSTLLEGFKGQSLGKRIVGLKVVRIDGKNLSYDFAAVRNFGKAFLLPFDLLAGWRLADQRFVRYFDKFVGTTVIDLRR